MHGVPGRPQLVGEGEHALGQPLRVVEQQDLGHGDDLLETGVGPAIGDTTPHYGRRRRHPALGPQCRRPPLASGAMATSDLVLTDQPAPDDVALVSDGLDAFNVEVVGTDDWRPLAVFARGDDGSTLAGLTGRSSLGLWFVDLFFVPAHLRGQGLGSEILGLAETEARRRGCRAGVLYTISFQAPGFYERHGWRTFGDIPCDPPGTSRVFMTKELRPGPTSREYRR